jgi:catechol-2,3-dioxygenase
MAITRLNHAVLYVRDVPRTVAFYRDVLGFATKHELPGGMGAFLQAPDSTNDHDIAFFGIGAGAGDSQAGRATVGLYHLAWEVQTLNDLEEYQTRLANAGALVGASDHGTTKSLYAHDPDGIEFEVVWLIPAHLLDDEAVAAGAGRILPLDIAKEKVRYGADTRGGLGISIPLGVTV